MEHPKTLTSVSSLGDLHVSRGDRQGASDASKTAQGIGAGGRGGIAPAVRSFFSHRVIEPPRKAPCVAWCVKEGSLQTKTACGMVGYFVFACDSCSTTLLTPALSSVSCRTKVTLTQRRRCSVARWRRKCARWVHATNLQKAQRGA